MLIVFKRQLFEGKCLHKYTSKGSKLRPTWIVDKLRGNRKKDLLNKWRKEQLNKVKEWRREE